LVIATHREDVIMLGIFSRTSTMAQLETWVLIEAHHPQFPQTGLRQTSLLKAERIAAVHESVFQRKLGELPPDIMAQVQEALKKALHI
jgi:mRNA interferase MazF